MPQLSKRSIGLDPEEFERQLANAHRLIVPCGPVHWSRPGSGWYNERMLRQIRPYNYRFATLCGIIELQ